MNHGQHTFVGLDVGAHLTLIGTFDEAAPLEQLTGSWPLRARLDGLQVLPDLQAGPGPEVARSLQRSKRPSRVALLVCLGETPLAIACEAAAQAALDGVVVPACSCALWTEGVMTASSIREYARTLPAGFGPDLPRLRDLFVEMMEEAAAHTQAMELEQDDSLLDRFADMRYPGESETVTIPIESLTVVERLLKPLHAARTRRHGKSAAPSEVEVTTLRMRCIISSLYPLPRKIVEPSPAGWTEHSWQNGIRLYQKM